MAVEGPASGGGLGSPACFFPCPCLRTLKREAEGSMYDLCNLTDHVTWKTHDNYNCGETSAICTFDVNRGEGPASQGLAHQLY